MNGDTPSLESAGGGAEDLKLDQEVIEPEEIPETELNDPGVDPLDEIKDDTARAEAKKHRAIARRVEKAKGKEKTVKPVVPPKPAAPASQEFITKKDVEKANQKKAVRIVSVEKGIVDAEGNVVMPAKEVAANWNAILPFYTPRRGKETPEDVVEDIHDAYILWRARNPVKTEDDSARTLQYTSVARPGASAQTTKKDAPKTLPIKEQKKPSEWYGKKPAAS